MKVFLTLIFLFLLVTFQINGQTFGIGIAYATSNSLNGEFQYISNLNTFKLGFSYQMADTRGEPVDEQLPNYGRTTDGSGEYFTLVDLGYGRILQDKFTIDAELSIGTNNYYTNYLDGRFNDGGYHLITEKETALGIGFNAGYIFSENWNTIVGYNSLRKLQFGIRILF